ncbi:MAG: hypothetical protein WCE63_04970 [Acidobacteriaceae bacterium]
MRQLERLQSHGLIVASFLNGGSRKGRERIAKILEMLQVGGGPPMWERSESGYDVRSGSDWPGLANAGSIQAALSRYTFRLQVDIPANTSAGLPRRHRSREAEAARSLVAITEGGMVDRLRCCHCGEWFMALDARQKHCGEGCRKKKSTMREEFRQGRAGYMKARYATQTEKRIGWASEYAAKFKKDVWDDPYKRRMANHITGRCCEYVARLFSQHRKSIFSRADVRVKWVSLHEGEIRKRAENALSAPASGRRRVR